MAGDIPPSVDQKKKRPRTSSRRSIPYAQAVESSLKFLVVDDGYPEVGVTAERIVHLTENVGMEIMAIPKNGLSLSFMTPFCHEDRYVLYILITDLRNDS